MLGWVCCLVCTGTISCAGDCLISRRLFWYIVLGVRIGGYLGFWWFYTGGMSTCKLVWSSVFDLSDYMYYHSCRINQ